ncbi:MAG: metallophosphoesterase [Chloroflexi bacterium]|nr:metallophosphoesterase [Chloroflexota bacterium]
MIRIVFTADNHLNRYYAKMTRDQLRERRKRIRQAFKETVDFCIKQNAHFYLHGGDLFDNPDPSPVELAFVAREFKRLQAHGVKVLAISGNHDMPRYMGESATPIRIYQELDALRVFGKRTEVEFERFEIDGTSIAIGGLAPDPRASSDADPLQDVQINPPAADVKIVLLHGGVEDTVPPGFEDALFRKATLASLKQIDYFLVGDIHNTDKLNIEHATVLIPGATERLTFGEIKNEPGFYYLEFDGKTARKIQRKTIEPQAMRRHELRCGNLPTDNPTEYVFEEIRGISHNDQLLQLRVEGILDRDAYHQLKFFDLWRLGSELNFYFDLDKSQIEIRARNADEYGNVVPEERVDVERELERVADELFDAAENDDQRATIQEARARVVNLYRRENA